MSDAQSYFDGLVAQGYTAEEATNYTKQYYPDFGSAPAPMPAAPMPAAPMPGVPMAAAPMPGVPMAVPPVDAAGGSGTNPLGWVAVGCLALTLILSLMGQFGNHWLTDDMSADEDGMTGVQSTSLSSGLTEPEAIMVAGIDANLSITYTETEWTADLCKQMAEGNNATSCDGTTLVTDFSDAHDLCEKSLSDAKAAGATDDMLKNASADCEDIGSMASAGSFGGMILWVGILATLAATVLIVFNMLGMDVIPVDTQKFGAIAGIAAGVIIGLAVLVWYLLLPEGDSSAGICLWGTIIGSLTGIAGGVLTKTHGNP